MSVREELLGLFESRRYDEFITRVKKTGFDIACHFQNIQRPFLHAAAADGHEKMVCFLIEKGFDVNGRDLDGQTPMHEAAEKNHMDVLRLLDASGGDILAEDNAKNMPLHLAVMQEHFDIMRECVRMGANIHAMNIYFQSPEKLANSIRTPKTGEAFRHYLAYPFNPLFQEDQYIHFTRKNRTRIDFYLSNPAGRLGAEISSYSVPQVFVFERKTEQLFKLETSELRAFLKNKSAANALSVTLDNYNEFYFLLCPRLWNGHLKDFAEFYSGLPDRVKKKHHEICQDLKMSLQLNSAYKRHPVLKLSRRPKRGR